MDHPRRFELRQATDVSGAGVMADGVMFPDGVVTLRWRTQGPAVFQRPDLASVAAGATRTVFLDEE